MFTFKSSVPGNRGSAKKGLGSLILVPKSAHKKDSPKDTIGNDDVETSEFIMEIIVWVLFIAIFVLYSVV